MLLLVYNTCTLSWNVTDLVQPEFVCTVGCWMPSFELGTRVCSRFVEPKPELEQPRPSITILPMQYSAEQDAVASDGSA